MDIASNNAVGGNTALAGVVAVDENPIFVSIAAVVVVSAAVGIKNLWVLRL